MRAASFPEKETAILAVSPAVSERPLLGGHEWVIVIPGFLRLGGLDASQSLSCSV
jgi:hypothetical protein